MSERCPIGPLGLHTRHRGKDERMTYRVGTHYGIHVYEGDRPVATFHDADEARRFIEAMNDANGVGTNDIATYRKRPVTVEAIQLTDTNAGLITNWICNHGHPALMRGGPAGGSRGATITIRTLEGDHIAKPTDWVIRGVAGEFYPCRADIFEQTYEPTNLRIEAGPT